MLLDSDRNRLFHMREAAVRALQFVEGRRRSELDCDVQFQLALVRAIEIIGEAASRVSPGFRAAHPEIKWRSAISIRNRLIHAYFDVNLDIIWMTVKESLPVLVAQLDHVIEVDRPH